MSTTITTKHGRTATLAAQDRATTQAVVDRLDRQALHELLTAILG